MPDVPRIRDRTGGRLESARLVMRPWPEHHTGVIAELTSDPRVTEYLGDGSLWDAAKVETVAAGMADHWARLGFGWRVAVRRDDGVPIAMAASCHAGEGIDGLAPTEHELGWWIGADHWRQGYGAEIGAALRAEAHELLRVDEVVARLQPANVGSAAIARRIGLEYERDISGRFGEANALYRGTAAGWRAWPSA